MNKKKRNVLFRADGSNKIGLGHIYRCLGISERIKDDFNCYFVSRELSDDIKELLASTALVIELEHYENFISEAEAIASKLIPEYQIDIVTLDGYNFNTDYQKILKEKSKAFMISIDDDQPFHYVSDAVINHAGGINPDKISNEPYTKLFLGHDYLLLRKEFIKTRDTNKKISRIHSILICFGGADPENFTQKILDFLKDKTELDTIIVVVGASYNETDKLKQSVAKNTNVKIFKNLDAESISTIMRNTDLAIVPSSTIALEAFTSQMILFTGITSKNQINIYKGLLKENTVFGIDDFSALTKPELLNNIQTATQKFSNYTFTSENRHQDNIVNLYKSFA